MINKWKYYTDVFVISDEETKVKLQEEVIQSLENDMKNWTKVCIIKKKVSQYVDGKWHNYEVSDPNYKPHRTDEFYQQTNTDYYSPDYNGYRFQYDLDKNIVILCDVPNKSYLLIFDKEDYFWGYPKKLKKLLKLLTQTVFTQNITNIGKKIPTTPVDKVVDVLQKNRTDKLKKIEENLSEDEDTGDN